MATKRTPGPDSVSSAGSAPARANKTTVTRKHRSATAAAVTSDNPLAASPVPAPEAEAPQTQQPTFEEIAQLAYSYWEARGYQGGSPEEDWLRAEHEIRSQLTAGATA